MVALEGRNLPKIYKITAPKIVTLTTLKSRPTCWAAWWIQKAADRISTVLTGGKGANESLSRKCQSGDSRYTSHLLIASEVVSSQSVVKRTYCLASIQGLTVDFRDIVNIISLPWLCSVWLKWLSSDCPEVQKWHCNNSTVATQHLNTQRTIIQLVTILRKSKYTICY